MNEVYKESVEKIKTGDVLNLPQLSYYDVKKILFYMLSEIYQRLDALENKKPAANKKNEGWTSKLRPGLHIGEIDDA